MPPKAACCCLAFVAGLYTLLQGPWWWRKQMQISSLLSPIPRPPPLNSSHAQIPRFANDIYADNSNFPKSQFCLPTAQVLLRLFVKLAKKIWAIFPPPHSTWVREPCVASSSISGEKEGKGGKLGRTQTRYWSIYFLDRQTLSVSGQAFFPEKKLLASA